MVINNLKQPFYVQGEELKNKLLKKAGVKNVKNFKILKRSLDARDNKDIKYVYTISVNEEEKTLFLPQFSSQIAPVIIGGGPSGMFCALYLARMGLKPIVIERGSKCDKRKEKINNFFLGGPLDLNSNVQFGEGGAGTFSDGKLNTGIKSEYISWILSDFVNAGANPEIAYSNKPHIGSDVLPKCVTNIRKEIESLGGKFLFDTLFTGINYKDGKINSINTSQGEIFLTDLILAIGHSARDTFKMLYESGVVLESKPFAVGLRIEHLREEINASQYGNNYDKRLPTADYKLTSNVNGRGVFTFCMCPGGYVMPSTSLENHVVVNGMSEYLRDAENSNSAVIAQVTQQDYGSSLFDGVKFQEELEKRAFILGGENYSAPVQLFKDYLNDVSSTTLGKVKPSYARGTTLTNLNNLFTQNVNNALKQGIVQMGKKLKGFDSSHAVLSGVESRTSSPIRLKREENGLAVGFKNLFPIGEGAGYAGGITSSAVDGIKTAFNLYEKYHK